ncbi:hypothetical protein DYB35_002064 [Aphanomyces astaci]|uniref:Uncharacterized protein n=2 Tax=Aphanomyces astaci TaxID=112090 RepID=A0A3R6X978_APHAT|nr:hypothetical protein DYB35_002064 [Aphanomyces astaci]
MCLWRLRLHFERLRHRVWLHAPDTVSVVVSVGGGNATAASGGLAAGWTTTATFTDQQVTKTIALPLHVVVGQGCASLRLILSDPFPFQTRSNVSATDGANVLLLVQPTTIASTSVLQVLPTTTGYNVTVMVSNIAATTAAVTLSAAALPSINSFFYFDLNVDLTVVPLVPAMLAHIKRNSIAIHRRLSKRNVPRQPSVGLLTLSFRKTAPTDPSQSSVVANVLGLGVVLITIFAFAPSCFPILTPPPSWPISTGWVAPYETSSDLVSQWTIFASLSTTPPPPPPLPPTLVALLTPQGPATSFQTTSKATFTQTFPVYLQPRTPLIVRGYVNGSVSTFVNIRVHR